MSSLRSQYLDLLRFLALPEADKIAMIYDNEQAWYIKAGEQPVLKLFEQFFEYADYLLASEEFSAIFQKNLILRELYSLMELIYESGDRFYMESNKYYQREIIEASPIWKLIRRLAQESLVAAHQANTNMTVSFEELICL